MRTMLRGVNLIEDEEPWVTWDRDQAVKKQVALTDDPIAMSCASYRLWKESGARWLELEQMKPTADDRVQADDIRSYYRGRLTWSALKGQTTVSQFRKKLHALVTGNLDITKDELGILYRLPYFYAEDTGLDHVMSQTQSASMADAATAKIAGKFTLVKKIFCSRANARSHWQFWFVRNTSPVPFMVEIRDDNVLYKLFDTLTQQPQMFSAGTTHFKHHRGHYRDRVYIKMTQVDLV
jgi:hypothetical protein